MTTSASTQPSTDAYWQRSLRLIAAGQLFVTVGFSIMNPFFPLFIQDLAGMTSGEAALWTGAISGINGIIMMAISPVWGTMADWFGHKRNILRAGGGAAILLAATGLGRTLTQVAGVQVLMGVFTGVSPAVQGLVGSIVPRVRLPYAIGVIQGVSAAGMTVGPLLGGYIVDYTSYRTGYLIAGATLAFATALMLLFVRVERPKSTGSRAGMRGLGSGLWALTAAPGMRRALLVLALVQSAPSSVMPVFGLLLKSLAPDAGATSVGFVFTVMGVAQTVSAFATGFLAARFGLRGVLTVGCIVGAVGALLMSIVGSVALAAAVAVLLGLSLGSLVTGATALIGSVAPPGRQGAAFGLVQSANAFGFGLGPFMGGVLGNALGLRAPFVVEVAVFAAVIALATGVRATEPSRK